MDIGDNKIIADPQVFSGGISLDDRGHLRYFNDLPLNTVRMYVVDNHDTGFVRAFHGHLKESKLVFVPQGMAHFICFPILSSECYDEMYKGIREFTLSSKVPQMLLIPAGWYHGYKTFSQDTQVIFFSDRTLNQSIDDDVRLRADFFVPSRNVWEPKPR